MKKQIKFNLFFIAIIALSFFSNHGMQKEKKSDSEKDILNLSEQEKATITKELNNINLTLPEIQLIILDYLKINHLEFTGPLQNYPPGWKPGKHIPPY